MKKIIPFTSDIKFNTKIYEITSISLEHNLKIEDINDKGWCELFGFTPNNWSDCSGTSTSQPPTWIRPQSLVKCFVKDYIQVIGHSGVKSIMSLKDINQSFPDIWLCDNLPNQYLIIKDDKFIVKDI